MRIDQGQVPGPIEVDSGLQIEPAITLKPHFSQVFPFDDKNIIEGGPGSGQYFKLLGFRRHITALGAVPKGLKNSPAGCTISQLWPINTIIFQTAGTYDTMTLLVNF